MTTPLALAVTAAISVAAFYVVVGVLHDKAISHHDRCFERARVAFADTVLGSEDAAARAIPTLRYLPRRALAQALVELVTDLGGEARPRLRRVSEATGVTRHIRRLARGRWRRRAGAAQLQMLLPDDDPLRTALLLDPHPVVRARAVETLGPEEALDASPHLFGLLGDDNPGVRLSAQQALLRCDARLVPHLIAHMEDEDAPGTVLGTRGRRQPPRSAARGGPAPSRRRPRPESTDARGDRAGVDAVEDRSGPRRPCRSCWTTPTAPSEPARRARSVASPRWSSRRTWPRSSPIPPGSCAVRPACLWHAWRRWGRCCCESTSRTRTVSHGTWLDRSSTSSQRETVRERWPTGSSSRSVDEMPTEELWAS